MKYYDYIELFIGFIIVLLLVVGLNIFLVLMIWLGIRSVLGKTLNIPPSRKKWIRMRAVAIQNDDNEKYRVQYYFEKKEFTAEIDGFTVYGDKAVIYVNRKEPTVAREFIPQPPMRMISALSCLLIAALILLLEIAYIIG